MSLDSTLPTDLADLALTPPARFTADQYVQMIEAGVFDDGQRVELIDGVITPMAPAGPEHNSSIIQFPRLFASVLDQFDLLVQGTIRISDKQVFDPDAVLLERKPGGYRGQHPTPSEVKLLIETAATSLKKDLDKKLPVYAAAGIPDYWVIDLTSNALLVHRDPQGDQYLSTQRLEGDTTIAPLACPELTIRVGDLLG